MELGTKEKVLMTPQVQALIDSVQTAPLMERSLSDWRPILIDEVQVYVCGESYIGKRFDQINFRMMSVKEAKEVVVDNLYALLRTKYFVKSSDEADERIDKIVRSFTTNLKTTLKRVSFEKDPSCDKISFIPDGCLAFRNGVYDFKKNEWLLKYTVLPMPKVGNKLYMYPPEWAIMWYFDYDFDPLPIDIMSITLDDLIDMFKDLCKNESTKNLCFELLWNMSYNRARQFDIEKFKHLIEIMGFVCTNSFVQKFVFFVGDGQNGKNSLFDGCFSHSVVPKPSIMSLDEIEEDSFATGTLHNRSQNIFLESEKKTYTKSKEIKQLTGSIYQSIHEKGVQKYNSLINTKFVFSANDQEKLKFEDVTHGFIRRINLIELFYKWDRQRNYLGRFKGTYDIAFSDDYRELKNDKANAIVFCYFAMMGCRLATNDFTSNFEFSSNDYDLNYTQVDTIVKDNIDALDIKTFVEALRNKFYAADNKYALVNMLGKRLYMTSALSVYGVTDFDSMITFLEDEENASEFFASNDVLVSVKLLKRLCSDPDVEPNSFIANIKKMYALSSADVKRFNGNISYVKMRYTGTRFKIIPM